MLKFPLTMSRLAVLACLVGVLCGCGSGSSSSRSVPTETDGADVNIYNLVTTSVGTIPSLDVASGQLPEKRAVATAPYFANDAKGTIHWGKDEPLVALQFTQAGTDSALFFDRIALSSGEKKSLCLVGQADTLSDLFKPEVLVLDRSTVAPAPGKFRIRFLHALVDVDAVDIYLYPQENPTGSSTVSPLFYKQVTNYIELPAAARGKKMTLIVTRLGVPPTNSDADLIHVSQEDLFAAGGVYFVALAHQTSQVGSPLTFMIAKER